jgi:hypothetical protein
MPIDAVYLDTNSLRGGNFPATNASLAEALELANATGVPIFVSDLVLTEAREVFRREMDEHLSGVSKLYRTKVASRLSDGSTPDLKLPDVADLVTKYDDQSVEAAVLYSMESIAVPNLSLTDALDKSAAHEPPFRSDDNGFRDSIIAMSYAEHSQQKGFTNAVLVSKDNGMKAAADYLGKHSIEIVATPFDLTTKLKEQLTDQMKREFQERQDELRRALEGVLDAVSAFLSANLYVPEKLDGVLETILEVEQVIADTVTTVTAGFEPIGDAEVHGSAELKTRIVAYTQPNPFTDKWVYQRAELVSLKDLTDTPPAKREIQAPVTLTFNVKRVNGELMLSFVSAEIGLLEDQLTRMMVRQSLRAAIENPRVQKPLSGG